MYINSVLSSMGAWPLLNQGHGQVLRELELALSHLECRSRDPDDERVVGQLHQALNRQLEQLDWQISTQLVAGKRTFYTIDFLKDQIAGKMILGKQAFVLSSLLASFPLSLEIHNIEIGFVLVPMRDLKMRLPRGVSDFEAIQRVLEEMPPALIKYPFLIIGFSEHETDIAVTELTSELDRLLLSRVGHTLNEMLVMGEKPSYDFKVTMPERTESITKEICAMANLAGGGVVLFGISDDGEVVGIPSDEMDKIKLRITNSVRNLSDPIPFFTFTSVAIPDDSNSVILACQVDELKRKPCLVHHRAYIRSGPSAQPADAEEIRKMVLGSV